MKWDVLAYDLACHCASLGERERLLKWTARCFALGKSAPQFDNGSDFDPWRRDPGFVALLNTAR